MNVAGYIAVFLICFIVSLLNTPLFSKVLLKFNIIDLPDPRKLHKRPIPRGAGLIIAASFVLGALVAAKFFFSLNNPDRSMIYLLIGAVLVSFVGFLDDVINISPAFKLAVQTAASLIVISGGLKIGVLPIYISVPLSVLWLVGISNAFNLLDGMDGLAAGTAFVGSLTFACLFYLSGAQLPLYFSLALAGAILGFLPYNIHPASVFMGDCGSLFLGFTLGTFAMIFTARPGSYFNLIIPIAVLFVPICDTFLSIAQRIYKRRPVFSADTQHFYDYLRFSKKIPVLRVFALTCFMTLFLGTVTIFIYSHY